MDANARREKIYAMIRQQQSPTSASFLAQALNVSRQAIVGDVALLRAQGCDIIATSRGYIMPTLRETGQYLGKLACQHKPEDTRLELYTIVDLDALVLSVTVEHEIYGEITGNLNLSRRSDVDAFVEKLEASGAKLLSELTMGIHLHTIAARDKAHFEQLHRALEGKGLLYRGA